MGKIKCSECGAWMEIEDSIDEETYVSNITCPGCGFSTEVTIDVKTITDLHNAVTRMPKARMAVHLKSLSDLSPLKEFIPELADVSNIELARSIKNAGMKWYSDEDYIFIINSTFGVAPSVRTTVDTLK